MATYSMLGGLEVSLGFLWRVKAHLLQSLRRRESPLRLPQRVKADLQSAFFVGLSAH